MGETQHNSTMLHASLRFNNFSVDHSSIWGNTAQVPIKLQWVKHSAIPQGCQAKLRLNIFLWTTVQLGKTKHNFPLHRDKEFIFQLNGTSQLPNSVKNKLPMAVANICLVSSFEWSQGFHVPTPNYAQTLVKISMGESKHKSPIRTRTSCQWL
jgi:hypothetical protein